MAVKLELIGKELIKPASPTPDHLRTLQLSFLDHFLPPIYVPGIFFYNVDDHIISQENVSLRLKKSLSETLTRFYPLAGRVKGVSIDCNDEGAVFVEARADCLLSDFLRNLDLDSLEQFVPRDFITSGLSLETWPLVNAQVTYFKSGGLAIAACVSHKIFDASSFSTFIHEWAGTAKGCGDAMIPEFTATTIYPPADPSSRSPNAMESYFDVKTTCVTKRFIFYAPKIVELKRRAASESVHNPTRLEAISVLLWKCALKASRSNSGISKPSAMLQVMDLRRRSESTYLTRNAIGNLITSYLVKEDPGREMEIRELVAKLRKKKEEATKKIKENLEDDRTTAAIGEKMSSIMVDFWSELKPELHLYSQTSRCGLPLYKVDFGWGNPVWTTPGAHLMFKNPNCFYTIDANDGQGIEAWVSLPEQDMLAFEQDEELLAFATPNPSVLI